LNTDNLVALAEHRLQISIDRLTALDTRAGVILGFIITLGTAVAALLKPPKKTYASFWFGIPWHDTIGLLLFFGAAILAVISLSIRTQWDSPAVNDLPELADDDGLSYYLGAVDNAVTNNNDNAVLKTRWIQGSFGVVSRPRMYNSLIGGRYDGYLQERTKRNDQENQVRSQIRPRGATRLGLR